MNGMAEEWLGPGQERVEGHQTLADFGPTVHVSRSGRTLQLRQSNHWFPRQRLTPF